MTVFPILRVHHALLASAGLV